MNDMTRTYAIYTRVSTQGQDDNTSQQRQIDACKRWGEDNGWTFLEHVHDTQTGKAYEDRAGVQQVLKLVDSGRATDVICWSVDRTGRDVGVIQRFFQDIYLSGGKVTIVSKQRTYNTFNEIRKDTVFEAAVADYERTTIVERLQDGKMYAFETLGSFIYSAPFGYTIKDRKVDRGKQKLSVNYLEPHPYESEMVGKIIEYFIGAKSVAATARHFNQQGMKSKRGGTFGNVQLIDMLDRVDMYAGRADNRTFNGVIKTFYHPALITEEQADRVKEIRATVPRIKKGSTNPEVAPFHKLIRCSHCGGTGQGNGAWKKGKRGSYGYVCNTLRVARNKKGYVGADALKETECNSQIALSRFLKSLDTFLDNVDVAHIESQFEYEIGKQLGKIKRLYAQRDTMTQHREALKGQQSDIINASVRLAGNEDFASMLSAYNEKLKSLQAELTTLDADLDSIKEEIQSKYRLFTAFGIPLDSLDSYVMPERVTNISFADALDPANLSGVVSRYRTTADDMEQHSTIHLHKRFIEEHASSVRGVITALRQAIEAEEFETVNVIMRKLGLRFTADFSQAQQNTRTASIRVHVDFAAVEELLSAGVSHARKDSSKEGTC